MTVLIIFFIIFIWLIFRELRINRNLPNRFNSFNKFYLVSLILLAVLCIWTPIKQWRLESFLSEKVTELTGVTDVKIHCNSLFDSIFTPLVGVAGIAYIQERKIVFEYKWCGHISEYLKHPENVSNRELWSLTIFTHESMHIRGEENEKKTECQAVQRNHIAAELLGVPASLARAHAQIYYKEMYSARSNTELGSMYFSLKCAPGKEWDENLPGAIWGDILE
jgi:hypothetical protein